MYQRLFEWVVNRINCVMEARGRDPRRDGKDTVIGVLDIYGFEVFPVNRWVARRPPPCSDPNLRGHLSPVAPRGAGEQDVRPPGSSAEPPHPAVATSPGLGFPSPR